MFKINWQKFLLQNIFGPLRKRNRAYWLTLLLSQVRKAWVELRNYRAAKLYAVNHTGQVIYLRKVLNDVFDPMQRRIEIWDGDFGNILYIYQRATGQPLMIYWRWSATQAYSAGDQIIYGGFIYEALSANTGSEPGASGDWNEIGPHPLILFREEYFAGANFKVVVPLGLTYNLNRMKSIIDFYRLAGRSYEIIEL